MVICAVAASRTDTGPLQSSTLIYASWTVMCIENWPEALIRSFTTSALMCFSLIFRYVIWPGWRFSVPVGLRPNMGFALMMGTVASTFAKTLPKLLGRAVVRVDKGWKVGDPKSEAGRRDIAIPPHIVPAVREHLAKHVGNKNDSLLFPARNGGHLQPSTFQRHFYRGRNKAKRPDLRLHDCRHTGAVYAAQAGATLAELMGRLGHSTSQAAMRYQHAAQGRDKQIAAALSRLAQADTPTTTM